MSPFLFALWAEFWLFRILAIVAVGLQLWALADVLSRPSDLFLRAGQRSKGFWGGLCGVALLVGAFGVMTPGAFGMFAMVALGIAAVYLGGPRDQLNLYAGKGRGRTGW